MVQVVFEICLVITSNGIIDDINWNFAEEKSIQNDYIFPILEADVVKEIIVDDM